MKISFPSVAGGLPKQSMFNHYYTVYYGYILEIFKHLNCDIERIGDTNIGDGCFYVIIEGKKIAFDYSDYKELKGNLKLVDFYFKCHYSEIVHEGMPKVFPFSPISFYNWNQYATLEKSIHYTCNNDIVLNKQRPYFNAIERRTKVHNLIKNLPYYDISFTDSQEDFWKRLNNCLVSVCVPGFRLDIADRGFMQTLAFGGCVISPKINTMLAYNTKLIPNEHYILCEGDFSDLLNKIEWCRGHRQECINIGNNAKRLFQETCTAEKLFAWIENAIQ